MKEAQLEHTHVEGEGIRPTGVSQKPRGAGRWQAESLRRLRAAANEVTKLEAVKVSVRAVGRGGTRGGAAGRGQRWAHPGQGLGGRRKTRGQRQVRSPGLLFPGAAGKRWRNDRDHDFARRCRCLGYPAPTRRTGFPAPKSPAKSFRELRALLGAERSGAAGQAGRRAGFVRFREGSQIEALLCLIAARRPLGISGKVSGVAQVIISSGVLEACFTLLPPPPRSRGSAKTGSAMAGSTLSPRSL